MPTKIILILLLVIATYLRINGTGEYYYSADEILHIDMAKGDNIWQVIQFSLFETHPPLGHFVLHYWLMISDNIYFARSLALVFGIALIPLYYLIGKKLGGEVAGLCAAILITFGHGTIVQSFVVRHYAMFMFFLSLAFYFYLLWKEKIKIAAPASQVRGDYNIIYYFIFATLACLTHFSGMFAIFAIAAFETISSKNKQWIFANLLIGIIIVAVHYIWRDINSASTLSAFKEALKPDGHFSFLDLLMTAPFYPALVSYYELPSHIWLLFIVPAIIYLYATKKEHRWVILLSLTGFVLGMMLLGSGIYQYLTSRRNLWILPFIIPMSAIAIANIIKKLPVNIYISVAAIFALGFFSYDSQTRFSEAGDITPNAWEYNAISKNELREVSAYLSKLDKNSLIVLNRQDAFLISEENPYKYMDKSSTKKSAFLLIPYHNTKVLFQTSYYESKLELLDILQEADKQGLLKDYNSLVFMNIPYSQTFVTDLITCDALKKSVVDFAYQGKERIFSREKSKHNSTALLVTNKQDLLKIDDNIKKCLTN